MPRAQRPARRFRTAGAGVRADLRRGLVMASTAAAVLLPIEYAATVWAYPGSLGSKIALRVAALCATLVALAWVVLAPIAAVAVAAPRLTRILTHRDARDADGFLSWRPRPDHARAGAAWVWAIFLGAAMYAVGLQRIGAWAITTYKEPQRTALLISAAAVVGAACAIALVVALRRLAALAGELLYPITGPWSPFTSWRGAVAGTAVLVIGAMIAVWELDPSARPDLPWRTLLDGYAVGIGATIGAWRASKPRRSVRTRRMIALPVAAFAALLVPATLTEIGADATTKYVVVTASPLLDSMVGWVRRANDFDRDGFGSLLGENDCAPFDAAIHPGAKDIPDDGIDQNCDGHDFSLRALAAVPDGPHMPVPEPFARKDWNVLFITIDAVRYDHTTFGGYKDAPRHRDTTPNLARLAAKSTDFEFAVAAAPGTMASVPAIITSKFFHNGLALDETNIKPGMPPRLKPENTLITEIFHEAGWTTGEILTHEYFADWGMNQGVDDIDLEMTKDTDPFKVTSHLVTDHILAWVSRHAGQRWFLWAHYLDPHGRYVAHPDDVEWGATEEDKYDSEIFYTDKHIGRLLDELQHLPGGDRTIIIVTSDHGDGFSEHGYINHGNALYEDLLHVPMLIYVPDNVPRTLDKEAVSGLDLVPTLADLCGIDVSSLSFEGKSLVPEIFYGREDADRVVFSETNWPKHLRSATSRAWKLIYDLDDNLYELYDLKADPGEKNNVAASRKDIFESYKEKMDAFLERVVYARDPQANQMMTKIASVLLKSAPTPLHPITGVSFDGGKIELIGWDPDSAVPVKPGDKLYLHVYFKINDTPSAAFKLMMEGWPVTGALDPAAAVPGQATTSPLRLTLDGVFASDHWKKGDYIRERFGIILPTAWHGDAIALGVLLSGDRAKLTPTGPTPTNEPSLSVLGTVPFIAPPAAPPAPPPTPGPVTPTAPGPVVPAPSTPPAPAHLVPHGAAGAFQGHAP